MNPITPVSQRVDSESEFYTQMLEGYGNKIRFSMPGIITAFNPFEQTVTVQPALREQVRNLDGTSKWVSIPQLLDVPIVLPRGGGFIITVPIKPGDECLIIFGDMCIDAWFSSGGVQNQIEQRRHDLSDAFAILGTWSQPNRISDYNTNSMQLRNESGTQGITISNTGVDLFGTITKNGDPL